MSDSFYIPGEWQQWTLNRVLGQSSMGFIAVIQKSGGAFSYIKQINISENGDGSNYDALHSKTKELTEEINKNNGLKNVLKYEDFTIQENSGSGGCQFFARMKFARSLADVLSKQGNLSEIEIIKLGIDMCTALSSLQSKNMIHGNINPGNIFFDSKGNYKLGGIGTLGELDIFIGGSMADLNTYFIAPEATNSLTRNSLTDIYSVGSVMYYLLNNNKPPFVDRNFSQLSHMDKEDYLKGKMSGETFPAPVNCKNEYLINVISTACEFDPGKRWKNPNAMKNALENILEDEMTKRENNFNRPRAEIPVYYNNSNPNYSETNSGYIPVNKAVGTKTKNKSNKKLAVLVSSVSGIAAAVIIALLLFVYPGFLTEKDFNSSNNSIINSQGETEDYKFREDATKEKTEEKTERETQPERIYVPNVTDMKGEDAEESLKDEGFEVEIEYEYSDDVDEGRVISQSPKGGNKAETGSTVTIVVSKGEDSKPSPEYYSQKIEVNTSGTYATMELFQWNGKEWESLFYTANVRIGENGASYNYGEGKKTTPKGTFDIGFCYGLTQPETGLKFKQLTPSSVFVDDPSSQYYNMLVDRNALGGNVSYENTYDQFAVQGFFNVCIFIEHNGDGETVETSTPNMGSVITICGKNGNLNSTFGCIDITATDMIYLLRYLDEEQHPVIIIS